MRLALVLLVGWLPTIAMAQAPALEPSSMTPDEEAQRATSLYAAGSVVITLGALSSLGLAYLGVEDSLSHLFMPSASDASSFYAGSIAAGCIGGILGLVLLGFAIHFDVESGQRRPPSPSTWWLE